MPRLLQAILAALLALSAIPASAQTGDGSLRGYVRDQQGGVLPGVTVTVKSLDLLAPVSAVSDTAGYYRLNNLPPGQYTLTADLAGFAAYKREGILMRAGSTFSVDIEMTLSTVQESVTVTGESPMIETSKPTSTLNIQGELLRAAPVTSRRLFSDVLDMAPGVSSRNVDDGVGRRAYYFHGSVIFSHVFQIEGAPASSFLDASAHSMGMGGESVADSELKLGNLMNILEDGELKKAARELDQKLVAVEGTLVELRATGRGQDGVRWGSKLIQKLGYLGNGLASGDFKPTNQQLAVQKDLEDRFKRSQAQIG